MRIIKAIIFFAVCALFSFSVDAGNFHPLKKKVRLNLPSFVKTECQAVDYYMSKLGYKRYFQSEVDNSGHFCKNKPKYRKSNKAEPLYFVLNIVTNKKYNFVIDDQKKLYSIEPKSNGGKE